jgi:phage terminase large subunit GpA-like protein
MRLPLPPFVSPSLHPLLLDSGKQKFAFSRAERKLMRKRKKVAPSEWAERHRVLTMSNLNGPWRNDTVPYLADIMDAADFDSVETVSICKTPQTGATEMAYTLAGAWVDQAPGPVLFVFPDKSTCADNSRDRLIPMLKSSPRLRSFLTGAEDDLAQYRIKLIHTIIYMAWSHSASALANKPIRYLILDETDKYPDTAGRAETSPVLLAEKRTTTYRTSGKAKILKLSTPTEESGEIWKSMNDSEAVFDYAVKCPLCGHSQKMIFDQIKFPKDERDPKAIESKKLAWYECENCAAKWDDSIRNSAVRAGQWVERKTGKELFAFLKSDHPKTIGFHIPGWISPFVSLSTCAASFLRGLKDVNELKDFMNSIKAEPWRIYEFERAESFIERLKDDRPFGVVPSGWVVSALVAGVDTQKDGFWYEIRAFGFGESLESWQVRQGFVDSFQALAQVLWGSDYKTASGEIYHVRLSIIDAMGDKTAQVYEFCRKYRGLILPSQGVQRLAQPVTYSSVEFFPGTKKQIPGGLKLIRFDSNYMKNLLLSKLKVESGDPGAWHMSADMTRDWAQQMCSEVIEDGVWVARPGRPNHGWDCSVLELVGCEILGLKYLSQNPVQRAQKPIQEAFSEENPYTGGSSWAEML